MIKYVLHDPRTFLPHVLTHRWAGQSVCMLVEHLIWSRMLFKVEYRMGGFVGRICKEWRVELEKMGLEINILWHVNAINTRGRSDTSLYMSLIIHTTPVSLQQLEFSNHRTRRRNKSSDEISTQSWQFIKSRGEICDVFKKNRVLNVL